MPCKVECQVLFNTANIGNLFQQAVTLLRKYLAVRQLALVLLQNHLGNIQQGDIHVRVGLYPLGDYPKVAVKRLLDILLPQVGDIAVSQTAETGKDEQVPDVFQPFGNHFLFKDDFYLVLCQITPVHFFQPDFVAGERVAHQYAVVAGNDDDALEIEAVSAIEL